MEEIKVIWMKRGMVCGGNMMKKIKGRAGF